METNNTLILCCDQHNPHITGCYGNHLVRTPNLDWLAARGSVFENAYTATPICVPARASLATGDYPFRHGFWDNAHPYCGDQMSWGRRLKKAGISVTAMGKLHFQDDSEYTFPDQRIPMNVKGGLGDLMTACRRSGGSTPKLREQLQMAGPGDSDYLHYDRTIAQTAAEFLKKEAPGKKEPWCLYVGFTTPHYPLKAPEEYLDLYRPFQQFPVAKEWHDSSLLPPALRQYKKTTQIDAAFLTDEEIQKAIAAYYALVTFLDSQVGVVLTALREAGLTENTRILYLDDHGDSAGEHGLFFKSTMNEGSVRIPLIAAGPGIPCGKRVSQPVSIVDIYPTLLDFYDLKRNDTEKALPGVSLMDTLAGKAPEDRCIYSEYHAAGFPGSVFMLRKGDYKLIRYMGYEQCQLFDLGKDPEENHDLGSLLEYRPVAAELNRDLEKICDPEALNEASQKAQQELIESKGGLPTVLAKGLTPYSAVPKGLGIGPHGEEAENA